MITSDIVRALGKNFRFATRLLHIDERGTGLFVDSGYMYKILTGQRNPEKVIASIRKILDIPNDTE